MALSSSGSPGELGIIILDECGQILDTERVQHQFTHPWCERKELITLVAFELRIPLELKKGLIDQHR